LGLAVGTAYAQDDDGPIQLMPVGDTEVAPSDEASPEPATPPVSSDATPSSDATIEIGKIEDGGPETAGLADIAGGPLPRTLWQGAARPFADGLIARLPHTAPSLEMRKLAIRALISPGPPPKGAGPGGSFVAARAGALAAMGEYQLARALLGQAGAAGASDPMRPRVESDVYFLSGGDYAPACQHVRAEVQRGRERGSDNYWQKALVFCQLVANETEAARTGLDLLRESDAADAAFIALADLLLGGSAKLEALPNPSPLHFAMLRQAKRAVPESALAGANPTLLRLIAASPDSPMAMRLAAVEAAEAAGTVPAESVGKFYAAAQFKSDQLAKPMVAAEKLTGPLARALLFRAAEAETAPDAKAKLLQAGLARARQDRLFPTFARAAFRLISKLPIAPEFTWFAGDAARALIAAAEPQAALRWYQLVAERGKSDPAASDIAVSLWPVMAVSGATGKPTFDAGLFEAWLKANGGIDTPEASQRASLALALLHATGTKAPPAVWRALALGAPSEAANVPTPAVSYALDDAVSGKRLGETVCLSLIALGDGGPTYAAASTLGRVVSSLSVLGLDQPARAIALEAALGRGL
jgi:hypothetical protein